MKVLPAIRSCLELFLLFTFRLRKVSTTMYGTYVRCSHHVPYVGAQQELCMREREVLPTSSQKG